MVPVLLKEMQLILQVLFLYFILDQISADRRISSSLNIKIKPLVQQNPNSVNYKI